MPEDQRLIEDYIPIEAISSEARREKSVRTGHISRPHLWWARRSLVAVKGAEGLRKLTTNWRSLVEASRGGMI